VWFESTVDFAVPAEVAFDYLVDPRNRPEWQPSLRSVELLDDDVSVGQRWVDVTVPGLRPRMETRVLERPTAWAEVGTWRGIEARLVLMFEDRGETCTVEVLARVEGRRLWRPLGPFLSIAAVVAAPRDLRRAARILSERAAEH
jgi:uncharacterized membrane protein